jgi:hypothetical protein
MLLRIHDDALGGLSGTWMRLRIVYASIAVARYANAILHHRFVVPRGSTTVTTRRFTTRGITIPRAFKSFLAAYRLFADQLPRIALDSRAHARLRFERSQSPLGSWGSWQPPPFGKASIARAPRPEREDLPPGQSSRVRRDPSHFVSERGTPWSASRARRLDRRHHRARLPRVGQETSSVGQAHGRQFPGCRVPDARPRNRTTHRVAARWQGGRSHVGLLSPRTPAISWVRDAPGCRRALGGAVPASRAG